MVTGTIPIMRTNDVDYYFSHLKLMETAEIIYTNNQLVNTILKYCLTVDLRHRYGLRDLQNLIKGYPNVQPIHQTLRPNSSYQASTLQHRSSL